jgi:hypothetical protein
VEGTLPGLIIEYRQKEARVEAAAPDAESSAPGPEVASASASDSEGAVPDLVPVAIPSLEEGTTPETDLSVDLASALEAAAAEAKPDEVASEAENVELEPEVEAVAPETEPSVEPQPEAIAEPLPEARGSDEVAQVTEAVGEIMTEPAAEPEAEPEPIAVEVRAPEQTEPMRTTPEPEASPVIPVPAVHLQAHWLLSLFSPAATDAVDWGRGSYAVLARGGRVESPSGSGELKKQIQMVAEGSVLCVDGVPLGTSPDVGPDGFAHPVFRAGFALAIRLPEVH